MWFNFDDCFLNLDNIAMLNFLPDDIIEMFINGYNDKITVKVRDGKEFFKQFGKINNKFLPIYLLDCTVYFIIFPLPFI